MKEMFFTLFNKLNSIISIITTFLTTIFGVQWGLFVAYLLLNIIDYITGTIKAKKTKRESSEQGTKGILKKVYYWLIIFTTFIISYILIEICKQVNINIEFVMFFGWFTLACLAINEARSIIENLVEIGINVPEFLLKGLEIAEEKFKNATNNQILNDEKKEKIEK